MKNSIIRTSVIACIDLIVDMFFYSILRAAYVAAAVFAGWLIYLFGKNVHIDNVIVDVVLQLGIHSITFKEICLFLGFMTGFFVNLRVVISRLEEKCLKSSKKQEVDN